MKYRTVFFLVSFLWCITVSGTPFKLFSQQGKVGLKDAEGNILIPAEYEKLGWSNGSKEVVNDRIGFAKEGLWGLLSINNNKITAANYSILYPSKRSFVAAKKGKVTRRDFVGLINRDAKVIVPFQYTSISHHGKYIIAGDAARSNYAYGVLNTSGEILISINHSSIQPISEEGFAVELKNGKFDLYSFSGKVQFPRNLDEISELAQGLWRVRKGIMQGVLDSNLQLHRQLNYSTIEVISNELELKPHNKWIFYDESFNVQDTVLSELIFPVDRDVYLLSDGNSYQLWNKGNLGVTVRNLQEIKRGVYLYQENGTHALLKWNGETIELPKSDSIVISNFQLLLRSKAGWTMHDTFGIKKSSNYERIELLNNRLWKVRQHGKWGIINRSGEEVTWCTYDEIHQILDGRVTVDFHGVKGIITTAGAWWLNPVDADEITLVANDRYILTKDSLKRIYDENQQLIYFTNNKIEAVEGGYIEYLKDGGKWRIALDGTIEENSSPYEEIRSMSDGYMAIKKEGLYGFIDDRNRLRIANRYDAVRDFHEGLVAFKLLGKWGYLNKREQIVIQPQFVTASDFVNNIAIVSNSQGYGLIDQFGKKHSSFDYDEIERTADGFRVVKNGKIGLLDSRGNLLVQTKYDELELLPSGLIKVRQFGQYGLLDKNGLTRLSIIYDDLIFDELNHRYLAQKKSSTEKLSLQ